MSKTKKSQDPLHTTMSLEDHLEELRTRLIRAIAGVVTALIACLIFGKWIMRFIEKPYIEVMGQQRLQSIAPAEGFVTYMGASLIAAVIISSPWIFYQLWLFVAAGLYPNEKRYIHLAVPFSAVLFITGALFFIFMIGPVTLRFLVVFNEQILGVASNFTFKNYVSFVATMMLAFGLAFQSPIAIFFLNKTGLVSIEALRKSRRYVIFGIVVVAAAIIPGSDPFSLFALSIPMYLLFELGILLSYFANRRERLQS